MLKQKIALLVAFVLATVSVMSVSASTENSEFDGTVNGSVVDYDAYQEAYPEAFISNGGTAYADLEEMINSYNQSQSAADFAEQKSSHPGISTFSLNSSSTPTVPRAFAKEISGKSNFDADVLLNNNWTRTLGYVTFEENPIVKVTGIFQDNTFTDKVKTKATSTAQSTCEFSASIYSGGESEWGPTVEFGAEAATSTATKTLKNNFATFGCLAHVQD